MVLQSINPATEELIEEFEPTSAKKIMEILEFSRDAFAIWKRKSIRERIQFLPEVANLLRKNKQIYASIITREMGKPIQESRAEIEKCALLCDYFYEHAEEFLNSEDRTSWTRNSKETYISYEPTGTILAIMPWNFPFWQVFRCAIPAIIAGNPVILKHAPNVSRCALTIEKIFLESHLHQGVFQIILVEKERITEITENILAHPQISGVTVTGSVQAGKSVAQIAGKYLKKSVMELGGSDPFIVLEDANIENSAKTAAMARCQNSGQSCIAAKRFILLKQIYKEFMEIFLKEMEMYSQSIGDPQLETTRIGPIARKDLWENLVHQVEDAKKKGARIVLSGTFPNEKGYFYPVTVIENISKNAKLYSQEAFGPVASIYVVEDIKEAIQLANDTPYGLGASLWTSNFTKAKEIIPDLAFGSVFVNSLVKSDPAFPFGGIKESGYGRELSIEGIREFTNIKTIRIFNAD